MRETRKTQTHKREQQKNETQEDQQQERKRNKSTHTKQMSFRELVDWFFIHSQRRRTPPVRNSKVDGET
jgi:hypothetical protein